MTRLDNADILPKEEVIRLYRQASSHLNLPQLYTRDGETPKNFLIRARFALKARAILQKRQFRTARVCSKIGSFRKKSGMDAYTQWQEKKQRLVTAMGLAREIKDSYNTAQMYCDLNGKFNMPQDIFGRQNTARESSEALDFMNTEQEPFGANNIDEERFGLKSAGNAFTIKKCSNHQSSSRNIIGIRMYLLYYYTIK